MVLCAFLALLACCRKDHFLEGCCLYVGKLWGQDGPALRGTPGCWGPDVTGAPSLRAQCRVMACREWGPHSRVLLMLQTCSPIPLQPLPTCWVWGQEPAFGRRRVNRSALSCEGRKCCRNHCSLSGLKRKLCKERKPGAGGFPFPTRVSAQLVGYPLLWAPTAAPGAAVGTQAWCQP